MKRIKEREEYIRSHLKEDLDILYFENIGSTNDYMKDYIKNSTKFDKSCVLSDQQTRGRGSHGRSFYSYKDGLFMSLGLDAGEIDLKSITPLVSLAVSYAMEKIFQLEFSLKWVNDIIYDKKKICGILVELINEGLKESYLIIGIGINLKRPERIDKDIEEKAIFLEDIYKDPYDKNLLAVNIIDKIFSLIKKDHSYIHKNYKNKLILNKMVKIKKDGVEKEGLAYDIDDSYHLLVKFSDGTKDSLISSEVSWLEI